MQKKLMFIVLCVFYVSCIPSEGEVDYPPTVSISFLPWAFSKGENKYYSTMVLDIDLRNSKSGLRGFNFSTNCSSNSSDYVFSATKCPDDVPIDSCKSTGHNFNQKFIPISMVPIRKDKKLFEGKILILCLAMHAYQIKGVNVRSDSRLYHVLFVPFKSYK